MGYGKLFRATSVSILKRPITPPAALGMVDYLSTSHEQLMKCLRPAQSIEEVTCPTPHQQTTWSLDDLPRTVACATHQGSSVTSMDFHPSHHTLLLAPGGLPANVAVGIGRLGGSSAFIGKVGEDEFGYMLADILKENNVNNEWMLFDPGARTALAFVTLRSDGELEFMFYRNPSVDMLLREAELDYDLIRKLVLLLVK